MMTADQLEALERGGLLRAGVGLGRLFSYRFMIKWS